MHSLFRSTVAAFGLAVALSGAVAAPAAEDPRLPEGSVAGAGERLEPAEATGGSRTIQLLLDLQGNKPSTFDNGARPARRDDAGAARLKPLQPVLPPQFALPGAPVMSPGARQSTAAQPGLSSTQAAEWAATGGGQQSDSVSAHRQGAGGSSSFDNDRPTARHLVWLTSALAALREHREAVLGGCAVVIGVVWLGALAGRQKQR